MLIWRVRDIVDIVHDLMKVDITVTFFMEGATFFNLPVSYGGFASYFNILRWKIIISALIKPFFRFRRFP